MRKGRAQPPREGAPASASSAGPGKDHSYQAEPAYSQCIELKQIIGVVLNQLFQVGGLASLATACSEQSRQRSLPNAYQPSWRGSGSSSPWSTAPGIKITCSSNSRPPLPRQYDELKSSSPLQSEVLLRETFQLVCGYYKFGIPRFSEINRSNDLARLLLHIINLFLTTGWHHTIR